MASPIHSPVHLENPEYQTRWYFKYFLGKCEYLKYFLGKCKYFFDKCKYFQYFLGKYEYCKNFFGKFEFACYGF